MTEEALIIHQLHEKIHKLEKELGNAKKRNDFGWGKEKENPINWNKVFNEWAEKDRDAEISRKLVKRRYTSLGGKNE